MVRRRVLVKQKTFKKKKVCFTFTSQNTGGHTLEKTNQIRNTPTDFHAIQENFAKTIREAGKGWEKNKIFLLHQSAKRSKTKYGRPKMGMQMGVVTQDNVSYKVLPILAKGEAKDRLQAIKLTLHGTLTINWINLYGPNDTQSQTDPHKLLRSVLKETSRLIHNNPTQEIVVCGDLNWDTTRTNAFTRIMNDWIDKENLVVLWLKKKKRNLRFVTHTYRIKKRVTKTNVLDHFLISKTLLSSVISCGSISRKTSPLGHCLIHMTIKTND